jgi:alpha-glucosidase (family GH31 glycosyl hydrolase)
MVSSRGYGFLLDDPQLSVFRLRSDRPDAWAVQAHSQQLDYRVFAGPEPLGVVRRFSALVGRQPAPVAPWELGPWWQPTGTGSATLPERLRREDVPGSLLNTYTHYLPCGAGTSTRDVAAEQAQTHALHAAGYAVTTYFNPTVCVQYSPVFAQAQRAGALLDNALGVPYLLHYNQYVVAQVDFTAAAGRTLYRRLLQRAVDNGYDGWMEDFGEYTPPDAVGHDGMRGTALHNIYPRLYHCAAYGLASSEPRPVVQFDRSGFTGSARCSPVVWSGDPTTDWSFDGLSGMATMGLNYGYSGVGVYGSDIGGYFSAYIAAAASAYEASGVPLMEALGLAYPRDPASWTGPPRYLFGPSLLVAPVTAPGVRNLTVPLPPGRWRSFWEAVAYDPRDGGFHLRSASGLLPARHPASPEWAAPEWSGSLAGGTNANATAPLEQIPLFVRDGTLLALLPAEVATLARYGTGVVHLNDRSGQLHLLAWPRGYSRAGALGTDLVSQLRSGRWSLRVGGRAPRALAIEAELSWRPATLTWRGRPIPRREWRFRDGVLRVTLRGNGLLVSNRGH